MLRVEKQKDGTMFDFLCFFPIKLTTCLKNNHFHKHQSHENTRCRPSKILVMRVISGLDVRENSTENC